MDDAALLGAHRVHLDDVVAAQRLLGGAVGAALEGLAAALAVAGGVDDDPLALAQAAEGGLVAEQLQGVDRLAAFADQEAVVVLALDVTGIRLVVLLDADLAVEVELVEDALDELRDALGGIVGPVGGLGHGRQAIRPPATAPGKRATLARVDCDDGHGLRGGEPEGRRRQDDDRGQPRLLRRRRRARRRCSSTSIRSATRPSRSAATARCTPPPTTA